MVSSTNKQGPHGIFPMLYAFFDERGELDREAFRRQVEVCIGGGAHGIALLGLITEVSALTVGERETLICWAAEDIAGRVPLMATIAGGSLDEVRSLALAAETAGANYLIVQPPLGQRPSSTELLDFYFGAFAGIAIDMGIQNAPEFLGVGLDPSDVTALRRRHENFTLMKGEGPFVQVKPFVDALGKDFAIFNGRGGLELPDNIIGGCAGMIPAPDCADLQVAIYNAIREDDLQAAKRLYSEALPYMVFSMQSLDVAILYGKRMFARRAGIDNSCACRIPKLMPTAFLDAAMDRWSSGFGPYKRLG